MSFEITPDTTMLGPDEYRDVLVLLESWTVTANPKQGFAVDRARDRIRISAEGELDARAAVDRVAAWITERISFGKLTFNVISSRKTIEARNRFDSDFEQDGFRARLLPDGRSYDIFGRSGATVGSVTLTREGWVGISESIDTQLKRDRTAPFPGAQPALRALLRRTALVIDTPEA